MIDLHAHTKNSDGTFSVPELIALADESNLSAVAITDHDTIAGWSEIPAHREVRVVRGMETSTMHQGHGVHLLAYLFNPEAAQMQKIFNAGTEGRIRQFVDNLSADYEITYEEVVAMAGSLNINRPHIALALMRKGYATSIQHAFDTMLHKDAPYYVEKSAPALIETIADIRSAGGVPVIAHFLSDMRSREFMVTDIPPLVEAGLLGIEVHHREHFPATREELTQFALKNDLIITGSSDFHGANKPNILGENTTDPEMLTRIEDAGFLPLV